jgi:hypothetical protein
MRLAALLHEVETAPGAVTVPDLATRLDVPVAEVRAMLAALRAAGRLGPEGGHQPGTDECAGTGTCAASCPGPDDCPFTVDLGPTLEIRPRTRP